MATREELRNQLLRLATDLAISDEELLEGCSRIVRGYKKLKKDEEYARKKAEFDLKAEKLRLKIYETAWSLFVNSEEVGDPTAFIRDAYDEFKTWIPLQFDLPAFDEHVPCSSEECWFDRNHDRVGEFDGTLYVSLLETFGYYGYQFDYAVCEVCWNNDCEDDDGVFKNVENDLCDGYLIWLRSQTFEDLDEKQQKSLVQWLELNFDNDVLEHFARLGVHMHVVEETEK
jgi:hypothetical protein